MEKIFNKLVLGYQNFREKYAGGDQSIMKSLSDNGQKPKVMIITCCDSRVDPALIFGCEPGDLFVVRNVASIVPPFETLGSYHGTSAALELGVRFLKVKHLIILGHSQCGGISALVNEDNLQPNDFISNWVSTIKIDKIHSGNMDIDEYVKQSLNESYKNCLTFPWIKESLDRQELKLHKWFFDIKDGTVYKFDEIYEDFVKLAG